MNKNRKKWMAPGPHGFPVFSPAQRREILRWLPKSASQNNVDSFMAKLDCIASLTSWILQESVNLLTTPAQDRDILLDLANLSRNTSTAFQKLGSIGWGAVYDAVQEDRSRPRLQGDQGDVAAIVHRLFTGWGPRTDDLDQYANDVLGDHSVPCPGGDRVYAKEFIHCLFGRDRIGGLEIIWQVFEMIHCILDHAYRIADTRVRPGAAGRSQYRMEAYCFPLLMEKFLAAYIESFNADLTAGNWERCFRMLGLVVSFVTAAGLGPQPNIRGRYLPNALASKEVRSLLKKHNLAPPQTI